MKSKMSNDSDYSLDQAILGSELLGGSSRLGRVTWLSKHLRENDLYLLQDGAFSKLLFTEVLETFVGGQLIATIILGFSLIERTIAGRLYFLGENNVEKMRGEALLNAALQKEWLTTEEHKLLNELRKLRNPFVHFHDPQANTRPEARAATQILESDAKRFLETTIHVLKKTAL